jgi:ABC-type nitrate/sulfonate/bicarbonate transport system ATPase subunit
VTRQYKREERLLTVAGLGLSFGDKVVLRDVSLAVDNLTRPGLNQGQTVALLGPSGIGKTQLFRCIAGLQAPTAGGVTLEGAGQPPRAPAAGQVGVVQQAYPLLAHRTVGSNLALACRDRARVDAMLERFGLADKRDRYPLELSGGQRQRVAIVQQLLRNSHFLLLDEPFSGLDILAKAEVCAVLREVSLADELNTTIFTTHDLETAVAVADTLWMIGREPGKPGATVRAVVDLIEPGLAWDPDPERHPAFWPTVRQVRELFKTL